MSNVFSLADRRARAARHAQPAQLEEDDIAFPSDGAPEPANVAFARAAAAMVATHGAPEEPEEPAPVAPEPEAPATEPTGDIQFHADRLELALPVAIALLAFASKDATRARLGVGIHDDSLCATDGHTLLVLEQDGAKARPGLQRKVWSRSHVDTAAKVARATKRPVTLNYADLLTEDFPPVAQVVPAQTVGATGPIGINPEYLGRLTLMAKACGVDGVKLVSAGGSLDPVAFAAGHQGGLRGLAVIMPMRI